MAGRPLDPVVITGLAYVWMDMELEGVARREVAKHEAMHHLVNGHAAFTSGEVPVRLRGVFLGQTQEGDIDIPQVLLAALNDPPAFAIGAVLVVERAPGIACSAQLISQTTRNRRWLAAFGATELEPWRRRFNLPDLNTPRAAIVRFTTGENRGRVRSALLEELRGGRG